MRKLFYIIIVLSGLLSFGQNQTKTFMFQSTSNIKFIPIVVPINYDKINNNNLTIYNPTTKLSDTYYCLGKTYELSVIKSFPTQNLINSKIDSFNPSGTKNFGSALVFGTLNFLFGKF